MDCLLDRNWFLKDERRSLGFESVSSLRTADNNQRCRIADRATEHVTQKPGGAIQVAIDDQGIDLRFREPRPSAIGLGYDIDSDMQATQNALEHADFWPIARNHHGGKRHVRNFSLLCRAATDNQSNWTSGSGPQTSNFRPFLGQNFYAPAAFS